MGSDLGLPGAKLRALGAWERSALFTARERLALAYADAMTFTERDVDDALVEPTATIAWENASSTSDRALRIASTDLRRPGA